jgi:hypothetical protein
VAKRSRRPPLTDTLTTLEQSPSVPAERPVPAPGRHVAVAGCVFLGYLLVSFVLYAVPMLGRFGTAFVGAGHGDARFFVWDLVWWPHALANGLNPFHPTVVWAPSGLDMAWATGIPGPALLLAPLTLAFGPVAASNVASVLAPALSGWAAFLLCRRITDRVWPSVAGGYLFGFSSYEAGQLHGHVNLFLVFPVALAAYLVVRRLEGSLSRRAFVGFLAAVLVGEFLISTEVSATMALFGGLALFGAAWMRPELRPRLRALVRELGTAYAIAGVALAPYLFYVAVGFPPGPIRPLGSSTEDLLSFVVPRRTVLVGGQALRAVSRAFPANMSEDGGYLGLPLLVSLVHLGWARWREPLTRGLLVFAGAAAVLSMGTWLHVDGHAVVPLPWSVLGRLPILEDALPPRFTLYLWLAVAVLIARWLSVASPSWWRWAVVALGAALLVPNMAAPGFHRPATTPALFTSDAARSVVPAGRSALILEPTKGDEMLWQAETWMAFPIAQGHTGPEPSAFRRLPVWHAIRDHRPTSISPGELGAFLVSHDVGAILVDPRSEAAWRPLLAQTVGRRPARIGGIDVYEVPPGTIRPPIASARRPRSAR